MAWKAIDCPQCSAPLPRVALWRAVKCGFCGALVAREETVVERAAFRDAWLRQTRSAGEPSGALFCGGHHYRRVRHLGNGEVSSVDLVIRMGSMPLLATLKTSAVPAAVDRYDREFAVLRELFSAEGDSRGGFLSRFLPEPLARGKSGDSEVLILGHAGGFWGSLADLSGRYPHGVDPRHAVWIWRRMLGIIGTLHALGWVHRNVCPEHTLVHPRDHGIRLIGWERAERSNGSDAQAHDLSACAKIIFILLCGDKASGGLPGHVPEEIGRLVEAASLDPFFCVVHGATGLDNALRSAAQAAFGPPKFIPLET